MGSQKRIKTAQINISVEPQKRDDFRRLCEDKGMKVSNVLEGYIDFLLDKYNYRSDK